MASANAESPYILKFIYRPCQDDEIDKYSFAIDIVIAPVQLVYLADAIGKIITYFVYGNITKLWTQPKSSANYIPNTALPFKMNILLQKVRLFKILCHV